MKKKYLALMLGIALTFSSVSAIAAESTDAASTEAAEITELNEKEEDALYGEITELGKDSITIAVGTLSVGEMLQEPDGQQAADDNQDNEAEDGEAFDEAADSQEAGMDTPEENAVPEDAQAEDDPGAVFLEITGEKETFSITEGTLFFREVLNQAFAENPSGEFDGETADTEAMDADTLDEADTEAEDETEENENSEAELLTDITEMQEPELEEISFEDLTEGDVLRITFDEEGNAETVTVILTELEENAEDIVLEGVDAEEE